jgi:hypothetical protein
VSKQKHRYRKRRKGEGLIQEWPADAANPELLATKVRYVGSNEHKARPLDPSYGFDPDLRSGASRCDPGIRREQAEQALQAAVRLRCVSEQFEGEFPRYVWARLDGRPYVARLINREAGSYKGWPVEEFELPLDREQRLTAMAWSNHV